jgi:hypothetical protein
MDSWSDRSNVNIAREFFMKSIYFSRESRLGQAVHAQTKLAGLCPSNNESFRLMAFIVRRFRIVELISAFHGGHLSVLIGDQLVAMGMVSMMVAPFQIPLIIGMGGLNVVFGSSLKMVSRLNVTLTRALDDVVVQSLVWGF